MEGVITPKPTKVGTWAELDKAQGEGVSRTNPSKLKLELRLSLTTKLQVPHAGKKVR